MNILEEKKNLLLEMIAFSTVDGHLHKKEYDFLFVIANELNIEKGGFNDLFCQELPKLDVKSKFQRLQQFYRFVLLMHADGVLHKKELNEVHQIAISMGLNLGTVTKVLEMMEKTPNAVVDSKDLLVIFKEQYN